MYVCMYVLLLLKFRQIQNNSQVFNVMRNNFRCPSGRYDCCILCVHSIFRKILKIS